ncbi:MAG: CoA pyrophosphatase [Oscillospiraceae bacterium]|jgi:8-oxo-dGTP pyrophosphatase MutT (NUDIX family)|nr:CoA pyrophosphatase [Oscillospiraceae bacterium]
MFEKLEGRAARILDEDRYRKYAVIAPFLPGEDALLFEVRAPGLNRQPGEICFPGGAVEKGESPLEAAKRETVEELLIPAESLRVLAPLDVMAGSDRSLLYPYLAELRDYRGSFSRDEVAEVFTVPFSFFLNTEPIVHYNAVTVAPEEPEAVRRLLGVENYRWRGARYPEYFYPCGDRMIWGITARFVQNLVALYKAAH